MREVFGALLPHRFRWVLYKAEALEPADTSDLVIQVIRPRQRLNKDQYEFLRRRVSALRLWWLRRWYHAWIFLAICDGQFAHFMVVRQLREYRKSLPICEPDALVLGPGVTEPDFRGRSICPRVIRQALSLLHNEGYGPFYGYTTERNVASQRCMQKAGFHRCGIWAGRRVLFGFVARGQQVDEK